MRPRKEHRQRKPKDILVIALRNLLQKEELICTARTYANIQDRVDAFSSANQDRRFQTFSWGGIRKIRRVA